MSEELTEEPAKRRGRKIAQAGESDQADALQSAAPETAQSAPQSSQSQITVVALQDSRWRCGLNFGRKPTVLQLADLTESMLAELKADPKLRVT